MNKVHVSFSSEKLKTRNKEWIENKEGYLSEVENDVKSGVVNLKPYFKLGSY